MLLSLISLIIHFVSRSNYVLLHNIEDWGKIDSFLQLTMNRLVFFLTNMSLDQK